MDDGYDGYYDDIRLIVEGYEREGVDKDLIKKIAIIIGAFRGNRSLCCTALCSLVVNRHYSSCNVSKRT